MKLLFNIFGWTLLVASNAACAVKEVYGSLPVDTVSTVERTIVSNDLTDAEREVVELLRTAKENHARILAISDWERVDTVALDDTTEGGEAEYYYQGTLEKIVVYRYGELFQHTRTYYLMKHRISIVFDTHYGYNRPMYDEEFNIDKSQITERRFYFQNNRLIHSSNTNGLSAEELLTTADDLINGLAALMQLTQPND